MDNLSDELIDSIFEEVGVDNKTIDQLFKKIYKSLKHLGKSKDDDLLFSNNPQSPLIRKLIRKYYTEEQLRTVIYHNIKRIPGNLYKHDKMMEMYDTLELFEYQCPYSGTLLMGGEEKIHLDHIIPVNLGGPTDDWNCLPVCESCNLRKSNKHLLDWWDENFKPQNEYRLVKIYEYMTSKLSHKNDVKFITQLTDEQIKQNMTEDSEAIQRLDVFTFLFQLKQHIQENKQYILSPQLIFTNEQDRQQAIEEKLLQIEQVFNQLFEKNKKRKNVTTDIELLNQQRQMVKYLKSLGVIEHYYLTNTYFEEINAMLIQGASEKEILDFCSNNSHGFNFNEFYDRLIQYRNKYGNLLVPARYECEDGYKLGRRISNIRSGHLILSEEESEVLDKINFVWDGGFNFDEFYKHILEYYKKAKSLKIPLTYICEDNYPLGVKARTIRSGGTKLSQEQKELLKEMGFVWDQTNIFNFEEFYTHLLQYKTNNGDCLVEKKYVCDDGYRLGQKISDIRSGKIKSISEEQRGMMEGIGFVWDATRVFDFDKFYEKLMEYKTEHDLMAEDGISVPQSYICKDGYKLGQVVSSIRTGAQKISGNQKKILESINFVWDATVIFDFDTFYYHLLEYKKFHNLGTEDPVNVPTGNKRYICPDGYPLGQKVESVRKGAKISENQKKMLDDIHFVWDAKIRFNFDLFYLKLLEFKKERQLRPEDKLRVPTDYVCIDGYALGSKVSDVRQGRGNLSEEQKKMLSEIGFVWDATVKFDFDLFYQKLMEYKQEFGDLLVPGKYVCKDNYPLGSRVNKARQGRILLDGKQRGVLDTIGFVWKAKKGKASKNKDKIQGTELVL